MKTFKKLKIKNTLFLIIGILIIFEDVFIHSSNAQVYPYSEKNTTFVSNLDEYDVPAEKCYKFEIVEYPHPDRLNKESYVNIYGPDGSLIKQIYR